MIDDEINLINPDRKVWNELEDNKKQKMIGLHQLKETYRSQLDSIYVVLNKSDNLIDKFKKEMLQNKGVEDKFFIEINE